ncbi:MAG: hypothetical protein NT154_11385 [Verrucomicrobia bacterium]|nr:hypothetical protein [Verrucomicrobiota bacterium]
MAKEQAPAQAPDQGQPAALPPGHPDTSGGMPPGLLGAAGAVVPAIQYKRPADWQEAPVGQMRAASFKVAGKDGKQAGVSVIPLPGLAGSDLDNVNRWRGQVGLPGVPEAELSKLAQAVEIAGQAAGLYDQAGTNAASGEKSRILAAITRRDGTAWFFKVTGDDTLVAEQKLAFIEFLKSVTFQVATAQAQLPPSHPPTDMMSQAGAAASSGQPKPNWEVPTAWKEIPGGQFLVAKFVLTGAANAQANVNVSMSPGEGGGLLANVNRWRGQLGLGPVADADLAKATQSLDLPAGKASLADIAGKDPKSGQDTRLLAVVIPRSGETWFYKLMGDTQVVQQEKDAFMKFVQSVKY